MNTGTQVFTLDKKRSLFVYKEKNDKARHKRKKSQLSGAALFLGLSEDTVSASVSRDVPKTFTKGVVL